MGMQCRPGRDGIKRHVSEGLGLRRLDNLEDVDIMWVANHFQLVDQGDIDQSGNVFQQLGHLRAVVAGDSDDLREHLAIELPDQPVQVGVIFRRPLWEWSGVKFLFPGSSSLGAKKPERNRARLQTFASRIGWTNSSVVPGRSCFPE
jgi:hypothetical protein